MYNVAAKHKEMTPMRLTKQVALIGTMMIASTVAMTGCSIVSGSESVDVTGRPLSTTTFQALEEGASSESDVLDLLGAPTRTMTADEGGVIYVYEYEKRRTSRGSVLLVFSGHSSKVYHQSAYVLVKEGVVQRWWIDEA